MLIIAVVVAVTIGITKAKLDNIISYTYYSAYSTLQKVTKEMLADYNVNNENYASADHKFLVSHFVKSFSFIPFVLPQSVVAETARLYSCPKYETYSVWNTNQLFGETAGVRKDESSLNCGTILDYLSKERNNTTGENTYMVCSGNRNGKSTFSVGPGYTSSDTSKYCTYNCINNVPALVSGGKCGSYTLTGNISCDSTPMSTIFDFVKRGNICVHEYECPEDTYVEYTKNEYSVYVWDSASSSSKLVNGYHDNYKCTPYTVCPDGTKVKKDESCPEEPAPDNPPDEPSLPTCTTPSELDQETEYCAKGYDNFNSSPSVCDYIIKPDKWPPDCPEGYQWNNASTDCKCVPIPRSIPRSGANFCNLFKDYANIKSGTDDTSCNGSIIDNTTNDFSDKEPDIILRNGILLYNLHQDPSQIEMLLGNTQGGYFEGVDNTNVWGYIVYADIDGEKGDSKLWSDIYPFYITLSGKVIPAYDTANPGLSGGDSNHHLQVSVEYEDYSSGHRKIRWLAKGVPFKEGACLSGYVGYTTPYCSTNGVINQSSECNVNGNSLCRLKQIIPVKFFF